MADNALMKLTDAAAEVAVLGAVMIDPDAIAGVADVLESGDFWEERRQWVYESALALYQQGTPVDLLSMTRQLKACGHLEQVGGQPELARMINETPTAMNCDHYARIVHRLSTLRKLMGKAGEMAKLAYNSESEELSAVFDRAHEMLNSIAPLESDDALLLWLDSLDWFEERQLERTDENAAIDNGLAPARVAFPWKAIHRFVRHLRPGMLAVVAAGSSVGKTTFCEGSAEYWARCGLKVVFFHLELSHQVMVDRRMARQSGETMDTVERGGLTPAMGQARINMQAWRGAVHYVHCPGWTAQRIATKMHQLHGKGICDVAVIDYLQKVRLHRAHGQNDASAIGDQVEAFKNVCEQLGICALVGSQINREAGNYQRKTERGIRGSGEVGEKANVVITLDRAILEEDQKDSQGHIVAAAGQRSNEMMGRIDKNTMGPTGDFKLAMNPARFTILDWHIEGQEAPPDELRF